MNSRMKCKAISKTTKKRCKNNAKKKGLCSTHYKQKQEKLWKYISGIFGFLMLAIGAYSSIVGAYVDSRDEYERYQESSLDYWECHQDRNIRGIMLAQQEKTNGNMVLQLGNSGEGMMLMAEEVNGIFETMININDGLKIIDIKIDKQRGFLISTDIYNTDGCLAGKIVENKFVLNDDCQFTWNRDQSGFEVVGSDFDVVFSIDIQDTGGLPLVTLQGIFYAENQFCVFNNKSAVFDSDNTERLKKEIAAISPRFEYVGKDWFGKRKEN